MAARRSLHVLTPAPGRTAAGGREERDEDIMDSVERQTPREDWDPLCEAMQQDPLAVHAELRARCPWGPRRGSPAPARA